MWSRFDLGGLLTRPFSRGASGETDPLASPTIQLHIDELVAMRGRSVSFGRPQQLDGFRLGDLSSRRRGTGLELDTIGPYQWGDDIRHMDWFATARTGRPQVKQFRRDVQQTIILAIDLRPSMLFGSTIQLMAKTACLVAAKIAWSTSKDHQPLGLLLISGTGPPDFVPPRRGRRARLQHLARIVDAYRLAIEHVGQPSPPLADELEGLPAYMSGDVEAVIISDFSQPGDEFDRRLRAIGARGAQRAVIIEDGLMRAPLPSGLYPLQSQQNRQLATVAIRKREANVYRMEAERHRRTLSARLLSLGMRQVLVADAEAINEGYFR